MVLPLLARLGALMFLAQAATLPAQDLEPAVQLEQAINENAAESQERVSALATQTRDLLSEYRAVIRETEALRIYNDNLELVVTDQRDEIQSINRQLEGLEDTNRDVVPLMLEMIETPGTPPKKASASAASAAGAAGALTSTICRPS